MGYKKHLPHNIAGNTLSTSVWQRYDSQYYPEIWLIELEDYRVKLEELIVSITDNQFMIHILNNMTSDYDLQLAMMEKRELMTLDEPVNS